MLLRLTLLAAILLISGCSAADLSPTATAVVTLGQTPGAATVAPTSSPSPSASRSSEPSPIPSAVAAILADGSSDLDLEPLPAGHTFEIDRETATDEARRRMNVTGPVAYVAHGVRNSAESAGMSVWLVIAKVQDMEPFPVGPGCPSPPNGCVRIWAVNEYAVAFVSDQTGEVYPALTTMREVAAPAAT